MFRHEPTRHATHTRRPAGYPSVRSRARPIDRSDHLVDVAEELSLEDELALLVLLARLVRLVILPANSLLALFAGDVTDYVSACRHAALRGLAGLNVDYAVEEVGLTMLTAEVSAYDVVMVRQVRLAVLASVDPMAIKIRVVG